ncbi:hypothetical protein Ddye_013050 [Dipteronia dyeriana]|uniref:Dormancy/auxin associated family protein n=1 Tax=Dipteronia dyeriana TaxID=168575 RepID=A0AAD9X5K8_9ROSI|nr:hypothetical protein Ddye_013050 [Dipteronia dyeriana]
MGFLHKLWDETLAGPTPESGLGKLRKYDSFSTARSPSSAVVDHDPVVITRSITIVRSNSNFRNLSIDDSPESPSTPSSTSSPRTPLTPGTPHGDFKRFTRRKPLEQAVHEPRSPTVYDWFSLFCYLFL